MYSLTRHIHKYIYKYLIIIDVTSQIRTFLLFQTLLNPSVLNSHKGLLDLVYQFLEHMVWEKEKTPLTRKVKQANSMHHTY